MGSGVRTPFLLQGIHFHDRSWADPDQIHGFIPLIYYFWMSRCFQKKSISNRCSWLESGWRVFNVLCVFIKTMASGTGKQLENFLFVVSAIRSPKCFCWLSLVLHTCTQCWLKVKTNFDLRGFSFVGRFKGSNRQFKSIYSCLSFYCCLCSLFSVMLHKTIGTQRPIRV